MTKALQVSMPTGLSTVRFRLHPDDPIHDDGVFVSTKRALQGSNGWFLSPFFATGNG